MEQSDLQHAPGRPVDYPVYAGVDRDMPRGTRTMDVPLAQYTPAPEPTPDARPAPTPVTTGDVQRRAEPLDSAAEVQGGDVIVPFGPELTLERDDQGQDIEPGFRFLHTPEGPRRAFRIAETIGLMPLLRFAHSAKSGLDTDDMEGMAALYTMIRDVVHEGDWEDFQEYATVVKAEDEELLEFVSGAIEVISARKVAQRGSSSATSRKTSAKSKGNSSRPGSAIPPGVRRPDEMDGLLPVSDLVR